MAGTLGEWRTLWSEVYGRARAEGPPELAGWVSSYTGRPIAEREMREGIDRTVERILALRPRRLLEIGCGTGLLLARLAPSCAACWATDFSAEALASLERQRAGSSLPVALSCQAADDLRGLPEGEIDTVVLNSVVQYFPDLGYLCRVLSGLARLAAPGARIFLGDLRSRPLLEVFHASVLLQQATPETPLADLRLRLAERVERERELVLDPALFATLAAEGWGIAAVEVQLKRGRAKNELTRFRYDAVLTLAGGAPPQPPAGEPERWLGWGEAALSLPALRRLLAETAPGALGIAGVPNARLVAEVAAARLLAAAGVGDVGDIGDPGLATVADLREALADRAPGSSGSSGVEPEALWALSRDLPHRPYRVGVRWGAELDTCDAVLYRCDPG
jgi:SAM-dependent methyltransferase